MASLAAVLLVVAYNMSEWRYFVRLLRSPRDDILVMLCNFGLTVYVDLTVAIEVGVVLSLCSS
jgi:SulP family sulfate permease